MLAYQLSLALFSLFGEACWLVIFYVDVLWRDYSRFFARLFCLICLFSRFFEHFLLCSFLLSPYSFHHCHFEGFVKLAYWVRQIYLDDCVSWIDQIRTEPLDSLLTAPRRLIQIQVLGVISNGSFQRENIRPKSQLLSERPQEVLQGEAGLAYGELLLLMVCVLVVIMQDDSQQFSA